MVRHLTTVLKSHGIRPLQQAATPYSVYESHRKHIFLKKSTIIFILFRY